LKSSKDRVAKHSGFSLIPLLKGDFQKDYLNRDNLTVVACLDVGMGLSVVDLSVLLSKFFFAMARLANCDEFDASTLVLGSMEFPGVLVSGVDALLRSCWEA